MTQRSPEEVAAEIATLLRGTPKLAAVIETQIASAIRSAVEAEREGCAVIAERHVGVIGNHPMEVGVNLLLNQRSKNIAKEIRARKEAP